MDLETKKLNIIKYILMLNDEQLIGLIENISKSGANQEEIVSGISWTDYDKRMLAKSLQEADNDKGIPNSEVMAEFRKMYSK